MSHSNISIFVPHIGCPNMCSFCNQHTISGVQIAPTAEDVRRICTQAMEEIRSPEDTEIAFFGGSFTAIPREYMHQLLDAAKEFVGDGKFSGIRISTRPDRITPQILTELKSYGVTSIELGAQSMSDEVLAANHRGHTSEDIELSAMMIRDWGFELGLQMMIGLYKSTPAYEIDTASRIISLDPDTARIYPVVILKGTALAELYQSGDFVPYAFDKAVDISAACLAMFEEQGIKVIKCGLHASEFVEQDMIGGFYHPAFRELCEGLIYRRNMEFLINSGSGHSWYEIAVSPNCISKAMGHKKANAEYFAAKGVTIKITGDCSLEKYQCEIRGCR